MTGCRQYASVASPIHASAKTQWTGGTKIMADPVIYGPAFSTYVRSVLLTLEEKGAPYR